MTQILEPGWVDRRGIADHIGVSLDTVDRLVRKGMPSVKLGDGQQGARRFNVAKVDEWLEENNGGEAAA